MDALVVEDLSKHYGRKAAVDGLSFAVPQGSVCGFLGPNGAGKTTTLRILFGLTRQTHGRAKAEGRVSGVLDRDGFHPARTARDELALAARRAQRGDADDALANAGLESVAGQRIGECSYGTRRRLALAAALLAEPDVLLLDEPATGLDPHALRALRTQLKQHADRGGTVLLSSHVLEEVAATCDRVVVVNAGRRVAEGELDALLAQRIRLRSPDAPRLVRTLHEHQLQASLDAPDTVIVAGADPDTVGRAVRESGVILHEMSTQGALEALYVGLDVLRTEFWALRTVASYRRALALAIAFSGFLAISFLGVRDLATTAPVDADSALSSGAVTGFVAVVYAAAMAGGEIARGGLALALLAGGPRRQAITDRLAAHAAAGAVFGLVGALTAAALAFGLLEAGSGPTPGLQAFAQRAAGTVVYGALMGVIGASLGLAFRSPAAAVITALVVMLALDPLLAGLLDLFAQYGPGGAAGSLTGSGADDLPPAWAGGLTLAVYATLLGAPPWPSPPAETFRKLEPMLASVDGAIGPAEEARIPVSDHGLLRGDGAFEVMRLYQGRPFAFEEHLTRLARTCAGLRLTLDLDAWREEIAALREQVGPQDCLLRILLTRGGRRIALIEPVPQHKPVARVATVTYAPNRVLDNLKTLSYAGNMLATRIAQEGGFDEALLVSPHGRILEGPTWSFFWVRDGRLFTPPLSERILGSITRERILAEVDVIEETCTVDELRGAEEAFIASTTRTVQPIAVIDDLALPAAPGPVTLRTRETMDLAIERELGVIA